MLTEENIFTFMVGGTLFLLIAILLTLLIFGDIKKADEERELARVREQQERLAQ